MIKQQLEEDLRKAIKGLDFPTTDPDKIGADIVCDIPQNPLFGDYTSNIALQLSKQSSAFSNQSSDKIAKEILKKIGKPDYLEKAEVAGPGFINFFIKDDVLVNDILKNRTKKSSGKNTKKYLVEFAQPNTHKAFHVGHLRNVSLGECLSRLLEYQGHKIFRATYGSDIGLPVAKAMWGIEKLSDQLDIIRKASLREKAEFLGKAYALGAKAYEEEKAVKEEIDQLNKKIYQKDSQILPLWQETKQWSIDYFDSLYDRFDTSFDHEFWESEVEAEGKRIVEENIGKVFEKSDGAVIFRGEKYGLHNRVFISSAGNPTYEAKELGLTKMEEEAFPFDESLHVVANEQTDYFKVVIKALEILELMAGKKRHIPYGMVNLATGKMSSRTGEVITAESLLDQIKIKVSEVMSESKLDVPEDAKEKVTIGAAKFSMLKYSPSVNFAFDVNQSVALIGDSGPYVQYTYARSQSVLKNAPADLSKKWTNIVLEPEERKVLDRLGYFDEVVEQATEEIRPNLLCQYILDLAKDFNLFYQKHRIIQSEKKDFRLALTAVVGETLKLGLNLLGIEAPEKM